MTIGKSCCPHEGCFNHFLLNRYVIIMLHNRGLLDHLAFKISRCIQHASHNSNESKALYGPGINREYATEIILYSDRVGCVFETRHYTMFELAKTKQAPFKYPLIKGLATVEPYIMCPVWMHPLCENTFLLIYIYICPIIRGFNMVDTM